MDISEPFAFKSLIIFSNCFEGRIIVALFVLSNTSNFSYKFSFKGISYSEILFISGFSYLIINFLDHHILISSNLHHPYH